MMNKMDTATAPQEEEEIFLASNEVHQTIPHTTMMTAVAPTASGGGHQQQQQQQEQQQQQFYSSSAMTMTYPTMTTSTYATTPVVVSSMDANTTMTTIPIPSDATNVTTTIEIIAPATLPAGYQFPVSLPGRGTFVVFVPPGGVTEGQHFLAVIQEDPHDAGSKLNSTSTNTNDVNATTIPDGFWRDGLCDCCMHGCCHPSFCLPLWCMPVALGQVMTRMKLSICGDNRSRDDYDKRRTPFHIMLILAILYVVIENIVGSINRNYDYYDDDLVDTANDAPPGWVQGLNVVMMILHIAFWILILIALIRTRSAIRRASHIPERCCGGCEDFCCAFWCGCCITAQMMRHTADYRNQRSTCCTSTGLDV